MSQRERRAVGHNLQSVAESESQTLAAFPLRRMQKDCGYKKKKKVVVHRAAHRENWLLVVFHLRRRGDLEGQSSITAAVFISCVTQSSWCRRLCGSGGALLLNINFNVRLFARLLINFFLSMLSLMQTYTRVCIEFPPGT